MADKKDKKSKYKVFYNTNTKVFHRSLWEAVEEELYRRYHHLQHGMMLPISDLQHVSTKTWVYAHLSETCDILGFIPMRTAWRLELRFRIWLMKRVTSALLCHTKPKCG